MDIHTVLKVCRALAPKPDLSRPRLVTVAFSHFCEKARWGLDLSPLSGAYYEETHCPAMHLSATLGLVAAPRVVSWNTGTSFHELLLKRHDLKVAARKEKTAIPKLLLSDEFVRSHSCIRVLSNSSMITDTAEQFVVSGGSSGILRLLADVYPDRMLHLYPPGSKGDAVVETEHMLDTKLAPAATNWSFANTLLTGRAFDPERSGGSSDLVNTGMVKFFVSNCMKHDAPLVEKVILRLLGSRFIVPLMCEKNGITSTVKVQARADIHEVFRRMDALLQQNNPSGSVKEGFLLGTEKLTAADIAFASLAAPIILPLTTTRLFSSLPALHALSRAPHCEGAQALVELAEEVRSTYLSAQYVLDLYEHCRFPLPPLGGSQQSEVIPKMR